MLTKITLVLVAGAVIGRVAYAAAVKYRRQLVEEGGPQHLRLVSDNTDTTQFSVAENHNSKEVPGNTENV